MNEVRSTDEVNGWQPIETAPRDGTVIWLSQDNRVSVGFWNKLEDQYPWTFFDPSEEYGETHTNGYQANRFGPTHWMPFEKPRPANG